MLCNFLVYCAYCLLSVSHTQTRSVSPTRTGKGSVLFIDYHNNVEQFLVGGGSTVSHCRWVTQSGLGWPDCRKPWGGGRAGARGGLATRPGRQGGRLSGRWLRQAPRTRLLMDADFRQPSWYHFLSISGFRLQCFTVSLFLYHMLASALSLLWDSLLLGPTKR